MPYQHPQHPHYYPQQPMHPSHGPPQPGPPPMNTHQGPPQQQHQQHMMPTGPPQQPHHPPGGYYQHPMQHPGYPPPPGHQQPMPPPNPYMHYSQPHHHYYQQPMQPAPPPHGAPVPHPHGPPPGPSTHQQQQHMMPPGPQQPHSQTHHPGYYHQPMQHPGYPQPPHGSQQQMPPPNPYMHYPQPHPHYYPQPMQPAPMPHGGPVPHPHGPPPGPSPHHQQHVMPPGPQQPHPQPHHPGYYHQPMQHPSYGPMPTQPQPPPPPPPTQPHPVTPQPPHQALPPPAPSPHHPSSRAHTPQLQSGNQTPTKSIPSQIATSASPSIAPKLEKKAEMSFPKNSVEATKPAATKRRKFTSKDVTDIEVWRLLMCLKSGLLAESSWAIDVLSILLNDDSTSMYFGLQHMPGMLEAILEHFKCCLNEIFKDMAIKDTILKPELNKPVNYSHWQEGNGEDMSHIQVYFEENSFMETSRRCICVSTILRNLSFIPGNDIEMSKHAGLLLILGRILMYKPDEVVYNESDAAPNEWHLLNSLREDTLVIISNISSSLDLSPYNDKINLSLLKGLLHWACSTTTFALDPFPLPSMVSPQRLALESLAKLSIIEGNVDLILATPPWTRIEKLFEVLTNMLNMNEDQTIREFSLVLISNLAAADSGIARKVALTGNAISRLVSFLETSTTDQEGCTTTQDMLRRAALTLKCLSQLLDNHPLFAKCQQRLLNLAMSQRLDPEVVPIIADVIFEISLSY